MKVAFRTDASLQIGTGHVMRCLTLADVLRERGAQCTFLCRPHIGHLLDLIAQRGHAAIALGKPQADFVAPEDPAHTAWLGTTWADDAEQTRQALAGKNLDWLVVDHYALDRRWERALRPHTRGILVTDDLADRPHDCDLLLDQNMVDDMNVRYHDKIPTSCTCLLGPSYALVRPEFNRLRTTSLTRRISPKLERLLVFLGGSDADNETGKVIEGIRLSKKDWQHIDVVVGQAFPALEALKKDIADMPSAQLHIQTPMMAVLMSNADLAITAGGSVTWEKCALGLPSLVVMQGANQYPIASKMDNLGAQQTLGWAAELAPANYADHLNALQLKDLTVMTESARSICDGLGTASIVLAMESVT